MTQKSYSFPFVLLVLVAVICNFESVSCSSYNSTGELDQSQFISGNNGTGVSGDIFSHRSGRRKYHFTSREDIYDEDEDEEIDIDDDESIENNSIDIDSDSQPTLNLLRNALRPQPVVNNDIDGGGIFPILDPDSPGFPATTDSPEDPISSLTSALRGSFDYVAMPLLFIAVATPLFTILYVMLGSINYRLTRNGRSLDDNYELYLPYFDKLFTVSSSVGRVLEKYECYEYATCQISNFIHKNIGNFTSDGIQRILPFVIPKEYEPILKTLFSSLTKPKDSRKLNENENCLNYKCNNFLEYFM